MPRRAAAQVRAVERLRPSRALARRAGSPARDPLTHPSRRPSARRARDGGLARPDPPRPSLSNHRADPAPGGFPMNDSTRSRIVGLVKDHPVLLFMKGNRQRPQCGFSAQVVQILDSILPEYRTVDVLSDPEIREGIKEYSSWPTIPQLYVAGEFQGGCDIVTEMYQSGELQQKLRSLG